jgi:hypothetical protein
MTVGAQTPSAALSVPATEPIVAGRRATYRNPQLPGIGKVTGPGCPAADLSL